MSRNFGIVGTGGIAPGAQRQSRPPIAADTRRNSNSSSLAAVPPKAFLPRPNLVGSDADPFINLGERERRATVFVCACYAASIVVFAFAYGFMKFFE